MTDDQRRRLAVRGRPLGYRGDNAGPGNTQKARKRAAQLGFDPNRWFGSVEVGMYRAVSGEPASYVRNIYKYYVTYQSLEQARQKQTEARHDLD